MNTVWVSSKEEVYTLSHKPPEGPYQLYDVGDDVTTYNLSHLKFINLPSILHVLRLRYERDKIYTFNGKVLISINPFKHINNLYALDTCNTELNMDMNTTLNLNIPHIYSIAEQAALNITYKNQSILVSGESGAGKTENTKHILKYLSHTYANDDVLAKQILLSNHILEMFGNSKTIKNNNSSRFGKFIKLYFDKACIIGANIENYLLEKSRISRFNANERSYHIFYCLHDPLLSKYNFPDSFSLYKNNDPNVDDEFKTCSTLLSCFREFMFTEADIDRVFYTLKIITTLVHITEFDTLQDSVEQMSEILGVLDLEASVLFASLTEKIFKVGTEHIIKKLTNSQIYIAIKTFCEDTYCELFDWLIAKINSTIGQHVSERYIGILDIFGFEIFQENGYEQLCINYTNEILQNIYNKNILEYEQNEYIRDGVDWTFIDYTSNELIVKSIERDLFSIIDEQSILLNGTNSVIYNKITQLDNELITFKKRDAHKNIFMVNHYAGVVEYTVSDYILKNRTNSSDRKIKTNIQHFKDKLKSLRRELEKNTCWFVRCLKPNNKPINVFNNKKIYEQLLYSGVIEGIKLVLGGFPIKLPIHTIQNEFKGLHYYNIDIINKLQTNDQFKDNFKIGDTTAFLKKHTYDDLIQENDNCKGTIITSLQAWYRMIQTRDAYVCMRRIIIQLQSHIRRYIKRIEYIRRKQELSATIITRKCRNYITRKKYLYKKRMLYTILVCIKRRGVHRNIRARTCLSLAQRIITRAIHAAITCQEDTTNKAAIKIYCMLKRRIVRKKVLRRRDVDNLKATVIHKNNQIYDLESFAAARLDEVQKLNLHNAHLQESYRILKKSTSDHIAKSQTQTDHVNHLKQSNSTLQHTLNTLRQENSLLKTAADTRSPPRAVNDYLESLDSGTIDKQTIEELGSKMEQLYMNLDQKNDIINTLLSEYKKKKLRTDNKCSIS